MKRALSIAALGVGFLALAAGAICFQVSYFYLTEPEPVKFYAAIMEAEGKSFAGALLPMIAGGPVLALVGAGMLWWVGRNPGLRKTIRWTGIVLAVIWFILCLNFLGFVRVVPAGILPGAPSGWTTVSQINALMLLRLYFRMFRPGLGLAPIEQSVPWIPAIASFPLIAFLVTLRIRKT
jgi:hypothetical protein